HSASAAKARRRIHERRSVDLSGFQLTVERPEEPRIETRADGAAEDELILIVVVSDEERAETFATPLRIGVSADDELLTFEALRLEPGSRTPRLVARVRAFRDDALETGSARALPHLASAAGDMLAEIDRSASPVGLGLDELREDLLSLDEG